MIFDGILNYKNGLLYWNVNPSSKVYAGDLAGTIGSEGYIKVMYKKKSYPAHVIVWMMHNGPIPIGMEVDHINHIRTDNRIENLRLVSRGDNMLNKSMYSNNKSGVTGVSWRSRNKTWVAQIQIGGKKKFLYEGKSRSDAISARKLAESTNGFHKNHGEKK